MSSTLVQRDLDDLILRLKSLIGVSSCSTPLRRWFSFLASSGQLTFNPDAILQPGVLTKHPDGCA